MDNTAKYLVPVEDLRKICKYEEELAFCQTTLDVPILDGVIGQARAVKAMQFGLAMDALGYNIFVVGAQGTGKSNYVQAVVAELAKHSTTPEDWCYLNNFQDQDRPIAVSLPAGQGRVFQKDMEELISELKVLIPKAFEASEYLQQKEAIIHAVQKQVDELIHAVEEEAEQASYSVEQTATGFTFEPIKDGKPISDEEYEKLSEQEISEIEEKGNGLEKSLDEALRASQSLENNATLQLIELEKQLAFLVAEPLINKLKKKYLQIPKIVEYLETVLKELAENHKTLKNATHVPVQTPLSIPEENEQGAINEEPAENETFVTTQGVKDSLVRYKVNLFVNNEASEGAPVVIEHSPYYYNLFGKIEYKSQMMAMSTDFTMIKPGAIHRANGGYLILQANEVLTDQSAWESLKKVLKYRQAVVENIGEQYRLVPTVTLRPEPIPLNVKIILIGSPSYFQLFTQDEDFQKFFKVKVDFDLEMARNSENMRQYVSFVSSLCQQGKLQPFNQAALGKIIEYGSRLAGQQNKLSTQFNDVTEVVYESAALAKVDAAECVDAVHVTNAIKDRKYRLNMWEEKIQEEILQDQILIATEGAVVGQVNGLVVVETGVYSFGLPARITARTYMGRGGVINIERETEMSGNIHSKGVLTLAGYLGGKFAQNKQLGMTAQITFEQTYDGVDGDSASSGELYAILSSLAGVPLQQNLAVTGSVDQLGEIQPIGGVTEKIEGFFDICQGKGLTGNQGVIIPARNIENMMLKDEVLAAVRDKVFHIYAVKTIEEGIELLSGVVAGKMGKNGKYPAESIFYLVDKKLQEYNKALGKVHF
ncbi:MAG: AAA family ATPase [Clostridia bacterium]